MRFYLSLFHPYKNVYLGWWNLIQKYADAYSKFKNIFVVGRNLNEVEVLISRKLLL